MIYDCNKIWAVPKANFSDLQTDSSKLGLRMNQMQTNKIWKTCRLWAQISLLMWNISLGYSIDRAWKFTSLKDEKRDPKGNQQTVANSPTAFNHASSRECWRMDLIRLMNLEQSTGCVYGTHMSYCAQRGISWWSTSSVKKSKWKSPISLVHGQGSNKTYDTEKTKGSQEQFVLVQRIGAQDKDTCS